MRRLEAPLVWAFPDSWFLTEETQYCSLLFNLNMIRMLWVLASRWREHEWLLRECKKEKVKGPSVFPSKFFTSYNKEGKKAHLVLRCVENSFRIMKKNEQLSLEQIKKKMTESPFFSKVIELFKVSKSYLNHKHLQK